jgi:hypothetical protein
MINVTVRRRRRRRRICKVATTMRREEATGSIPGICNRFCDSRRAQIKKERDMFERHDSVFLYKVVDQKNFR